MKIISKHRTRALLAMIIAAVAILCSASTAYAYTVDDLRDFTGLKRIRTSEFREWIDSIIANYDLASKDKEISHILDRMDLQTGNQAKYNEVREQQTTIENEVATLIGNGGSANEVLEAMNRLEDVTKRANKYTVYSFDLSSDSIDDLYENAKEAYKSVQYYIEALKHKDYEIGLIGENSQSIVGANWEIYECFDAKGDTPDKNGNYTYSNGLKFKVSSSAVTEVYSQFKGKVEKITTNKDGTFTVTIGHGYGLITKIIGLNEVYVANNDAIGQYEKIGKVENKLLKGKEMNIRDNVELQIKLDNSYVNPLLIYGTSGLNQFYTWVNEHPGCGIDTTFVKTIKDEIVKVDDDDYTDGQMATEAYGYEKAETSIDGSETLVPDRNDSSFDYDNPR